MRHHSDCHVAVFALLVLSACGGGPPSDAVREQVTRAVYAANTAMFDATKDSADVVGIEVGAWETQEFGEATLYEASWKAKLRFKEPIACTLAEIDGKNLVKVVAETGEDLPFEGRCGGGVMNGKWDLHANAQDKGDDILGPGAWKAIYARVEGLTMGYPVIQNGVQSGAKTRRQNFEPLSRLQPYVIEGSDEHKVLQKAIAERVQKQMAENAAQQQRARAEEEERRRAQQEEQTRLAAAAAEKQRLAEAERQQQQAEAAEQARVAAEAKKRLAEEQRHAQLLAVLKPFQSGAGAVITAEAGPLLGTVLLEPAIDAPKLTVSAPAVDLREMPFREFPFDGAVDARGAFTARSSLGGDPVAYSARGESLVSRTGYTIAALTAADREKLVALIALGKRLGAAPPAALTVESLDAEAAKTREPQLQLAGLTGSVFYRGRLDARVAPLFAADLASNRSYAWKNKEVVSIRLAEPVRGSGIYVRGTAAQSTEMIVTVNGVHRATVASIPKLGGVILALPADLEVLDLRFEATGSVTSRTIGLIR